MKRTLLVVLGLSAALGGCNCGDKLAQSRPAISVSPQALDFGADCAGQVDRTVDITNGGQARLDLTAVKVTSGSGPGAFLVGTFPSSVAAGASATVTVSYRVSGVGQDTASLVIDSDASNTPELIVPLAGQGLDCASDAGEPDAGVDAGNPDAGELDAGNPDAGELDAGTPDSGSSDGGACPVENAASIIRTGTYVGLGHVLWNGQGYSAIWNERPIDGGPFNNDFELLDATGASAGPVNVISGPNAFHPRMAFNGSEYAVVWSDDRSSPRQIYFELLDTTGAVIPGSALQLSPSTVEQNSATVVWNPTSQEWAAAWLEGFSPASVQFVRLTAGGAVIAGSQRRLSSDSAWGFYETGSGPLFWNGSSYGVAWSEGNSVLYLSELAADGTTQSQTVVAPGATVDPDRVVVASDGNVWGVAWMDSRTSVNQVHFARVQAGGGYVANSDLVLGTPGTGYSGEPSIVWAGSAFALAWTDTPNGQDVFFARIDPSGNVLERRDVISTPEWDAWPDLTWNGCNVAITDTWIGGTAADQRLFIGP